MGSALADQHVTAALHRGACAAWAWQTPALHPTVAPPRVLPCAL
jgi:hypothetical protein